MKCSKCGKEFNDESRFCPHCGIEVISIKEENNVKEDSAKPSNQSKGKEVRFLNKSYTYEHIVFAIFTVIILVACFLPYYSVSMFGASSSIKILDVDLGYIVPSLAIVCLIMFLVKNEFMMMWIGIVELIFSFLIYIGVSENAKEIGFGGFSIGCYLILISAVCLGVIGSHLSIKFKKDKSERSPFMNSMVLRFKIGVGLIAFLVIAFILIELFS